MRAVLAWTECPPFDSVHPAFPLPTTASPTLQSALKNGFRGASVACDMLESFRTVQSLALRYTLVDVNFVLMSFYLR